MSENILKLTDNVGDFAIFEAEPGELYVTVNDGISVELSKGDVVKLKKFLEEMFPTPEASSLPEVGCMQKVGEDLVMDSRRLPANITLNVTGNVTINN
ncbi:hypothetical protein PHB09_068 [Pseudomonas phage PHB09]|uniref:Uncharacterized protein n=1 Tax=Pseudomonas phage PHB09 TaxID=2867265 RepID=A0AAE8XCA0_9CAUD|nr:hypothetical protein QGX10_gp068 [Pseudomonas phage PHB09]UAV84564.1 hypothetical protein PHB09_068 [Pseudomonas phage PHB09]